MIRILMILLALSAGIYGAHALGLGEGNRFGRMGSIKKSGAGTPPPATCNGTGLIFNVACNSQYIGIL